MEHLSRGLILSVGKLFDFKKWVWSMMPISHYVGLILSHGVQMCSFFSIICCKRLENASRYKTSLKQLTLIMNIGCLDFDGPSEQSQSVSRAKTHKTLKCTFGSKIGVFLGAKLIIIHYYRSEEGQI